jgi:hypothetical protein
MKVGDLVMFFSEKSHFSRRRLGVVTEVFTYQRGELREGSPLVGMPMASVHWSGLDGPMMHRQDLLEVRSESR